MLEPVEGSEWLFGPAGDHLVLRASDRVTLNYPAVSGADRARALRAMSNMLKDAGYCAIATSRSGDDQAWLALCEAGVAAGAGRAADTAAAGATLVAETLLGSVGQGGDNHAGDVLKVKEKLDLCGFGFFAMNPHVEPGLILAIRLFQSIIAGRNRIGGVDGRIDVGGFTWGCLSSDGAPRWQLMPAAGTGYVNFERRDLTDHHDFGTNWLASTIAAAGQLYNQNYLASHPGACLLTINDASLPRGGDTPDHAGHETGLACDIRLPRVDGDSGGIANPNTNRAYDRDAMRAQLVALRTQPLFRRAFFNDSTLVEEGICERLAGHNNHAHIEISSSLSSVSS